MNREEIQRRLIEGIRDSYTLNLAISILEDLDIANKKLEDIKEVLNLYSNATIENPNNGYILYQKIKSIIGKESNK